MEETAGLQGAGGGEATFVPSWSHGLRSPPIPPSPLPHTHTRGTPGIRTAWSTVAGVVQRIRSRICRAAGCCSHVAQVPAPSNPRARCATSGTMICPPLGHVSFYNTNSPKFTWFSPATGAVPGNQEQHCCIEANKLNEGRSFISLLGDLFLAPSDRYTP